MLKIIFIIFFVAVLCNAQVNNFFPLDLGNKYQYISRGWTANGTTYSLNENEINRDTFYNAKKYFGFSNSNYWYYYDEDSSKLLIRLNENEGLYCDFTVPNGGSFPQYNPLNNTHRLVSVKIDSGYFFGEKRTTFQYLYSGGGGSDGEKYAAGLGSVFRNSSYYGIGPNYEGSANLINAIIKDSSGNEIFYSEGQKPVIVYEPFNYIQVSLVKNFTANISHAYNRINNFLGSQSIGINYIDSVYIEFYNYTDSLLSGVMRKLGSRSGLTNEYKFLIHLDSVSFKPYHKLNYRIVAKDKALIPIKVYSPPEGFYQAFIYGPPVNIDENILEYEFQLHQNYPNPFNPETRIKYQVSSNSFVTLKVYDILGNEIATLVNEEKQPGEYEIDFDAAKYNLSSGVYFYRLRAGEFTSTKKFLLMK